MRRACLIAFIACLVCLTALSGPVMAETTMPDHSLNAQAGPYAQANGTIYVRGGPGTSFWVVGTLIPGEIVPISGVSPDGGWWYIVASYGEGWVSNVAVTAFNTTGVPMRDPGSTGVVLSSVLNVREGAGPTAYRLGTLNQGEQVFVIGQNTDGTWLQIRWAYGTGWVSEPFLAVSGGAVGVVADGALPVTAPAAFGVVTVTYLNVRSGPSLNYDIIGQVYGGQQVPITGQSADGQWFQVDTEAGTGWVYSSYMIARNEYGGAPVVAEAADGQGGLVGPIGVVNTGALNLRSGPGPQYSVVGIVPGGSEGVIVGRNGDWSWWLMETDVGTGWASGLYILVRGDTFGIPYAEPGQAAVPQVGDQPGGVAPPSEAALPIAVVSSGALNIRTGPNGAFDSLGTVETGTHLTVIGQSPDRGWWLVESPVGTGWVSKLYVIVNGDTSNVPVQ